MQTTAPWSVVLEFARAQHAEDPHGFRFEPQDYLLRRAGGGFERASFVWNAALMADLEAVRRPKREPVVLKRMGETLRGFLRPLGWEKLSKQILEARQQERRVLLTIRSAAAELYALPWELLTMEGSGEHVGALEGVLLRYEWPEIRSRPELPVPRQGAGRILLAWSAAGGAVPASLHGRAIRTACQGGNRLYEAARDELANVSLGRLHAALSAAKKNNQPISVLHLLAHGGSVGDTFGLLLDEESSGDGPVVVDAGRLQQVLSPYAGMVRLVVLLACDSGNVGAPGNQLGSVAQSLHRAGMAAVVASRYPMSVAGSVQLTEALYRGLLNGLDSLERAVLVARSELAKEVGHTDWASVQLYARADDGDDTRPIVYRPYNGLASFEAEQSRFYHGRGPLTEKLWQRCRELFGRPSGTRLLTVLGPSGSGKSSVARAGLMVELERRPLPGLGPLRVVVFKPGDHPQRALESALGEPADAAAMTPLLVLVDQFEEVYTQCTEPAERDGFVAWLLSAARDKGRGICVVLTLRSDFYGETQKHHRELNQVIAQQHELIPGLTDAELREVIAEPARQVGRPLDADTVELLLKEAQGSESALPLLEFALTRIWEGVLCGKEPGTTLREIGGIGGALADQAKEIFGALSAREQATARRAMTRLVKLGEGTRDTRRRAAVQELCGRGESAEEVLSVLRKFTAENVRIVTLSSAGQQVLAEVTHEALFDNWSELRKWIDQGRADRRFHDRVAEAVRLWNEDRKGSGRLWRPPDLDLLRAFAARKAEDLSAADEQFFAASEQAYQAEIGSKKQRARWLRIGLAVVSLLFMVSVFITAYALRQKRVANDQRDHAEQRELDMVVEKGRQLLVEKEQPIEALLWLQRAADQGSRSPILSELLGYAARPLEDVQLVLAGHLEPVHSAHYGPDGSSIVTASSDKTARVWDAKTGQLLITLQGHSADVRTGSYSPNGQSIVTASLDKTARVWDARTGQLLKALQGHSDGVTSASYSPDGQSILTASLDKTARVWDAKTGQMLITIRGYSAAYYASYSPDGLSIVTANQDSNARVWDAKTGLELNTLSGHSDAIFSANYSPDGRSIVTAGSDKSARVWDARTGRLIRTLQGHSYAVFSASYSPDGRSIVTAGFDKTARVWDAKTGQLLVTLQGHSEAVHSASYSLDGRSIVTASWDRTERVWDAKASQLLPTLQGHSGNVYSADYSPNGRSIVTASADRSARVWDARTGQLLTTLQGHDNRVNSASYSPDGQSVVTASLDRSVRVWDAQTGQLLTTLQGHSADVNSASYSPDGRSIVSASSDRSARVWDAKTGQLLTTLGHSERVHYANYSPDGRSIVTTSFNQPAQIWDAKTGQLLTTLQRYSVNVNSASYSPDGRSIVTASSDRSVRVWDAKTGQLLTTLQGHSDNVHTASYSPDGRRIVTASSDKSARVWDAKTGQLIHIMMGHSAAVYSASYSPDGRSIVTASSDKTARLWDVEPRIRSTDELGALIRCRSVERLQGDLFVAAATEQEVCPKLSSPAPSPLRWSARFDPYWSGIYALKAGRRMAAQTFLLEARRQLELFRDAQGLVLLSLTEHAILEDDFAPPPAAIVNLMHKIELRQQKGLWFEIAVLAQDSLYHPRWALWALGELARILPEDSRILNKEILDDMLFGNGPLKKELWQGVNDPGLGPKARLYELEAYLSAGLSQEVLQQAPLVLSAQSYTSSKAMVSLLVWLAAVQAASRKDQQTWAKRAFDFYGAIKEDTVIDWNLDGIRHAFLNQPESAARTAALQLFRLLERRKGAVTTLELSKLLAVPAPRSLARQFR